MPILTENEKALRQPAGFISVIYDGTNEVFRKFYPDADNDVLTAERKTFQDAYTQSHPSSSLSASEELIWRDDNPDRLPFGARRLSGVPKSERATR